MRFKKLGAFGSALVLSISSLLLFAAPHAFAATITWSGGGSDGLWSTTGNWVGGVAPTNGDSVVIDNAATFTNGSHDDIASLSLASITFTNNSGSGVAGILLDQNLTVTTAITQASSVTTTTNYIHKSSTAKTLTLGGDVTVLSSKGISLGDLGDTLALGAHTLTFTDYGGSSSGIVAVDANITGTGGIVYNGPATDFQLAGANTYSGPTHVISNYLYVGGTSNNNAFGTSTITIENGGSISLDFNTDHTVSNVIFVQGTASGSPVTSISFGPAASTTLTVPSITLNGNTRFGGSVSGSTVNLAGIVANGHCVEYLGFGTVNDGPSNGFVNGPAGCVVNAAVASSKAPKTGFALISAQPGVTFAVAAGAAGALFVLARRSGKLARKK